MDHGLARRASLPGIGEVAQAAGSPFVDPQARHRDCATWKVTGPEVERTGYRDLEAMLLADFEANRSEGYLASARYRLAHLRRALGSVLARDITHERLNRYKTDRLKHAKPATVRYELRLLHRMLVLGLGAERVDRLPRFPAVEVDNARQGFATPAEVARVIEGLPEHVAPVVGLLSLTGMRSHEALELRWSRVDFEAGRSASAPRTPRLASHAASRFANAPTLAALLKRQRERVTALEREHGAIIPEVFPDVAPVTFKRHWHRAVKAAGVPALRPHDLRRSFARNAIRSGMSQHVAMAILGHTTLAMFARYNVTSSEDRSEEMGRVDAFVSGATATPNATREGEASNVVELNGIEPSTS